tara:strand:+ start:27156 stop:28388 length:1233 start_codon:yes stop_codon:yes gene_type:complete
MKRCVGISKFAILSVLLALGFYSIRPQDFEVTATSGRTYTSPSLPTGYADGFDFPVGGGSAYGYYTARRMVPYQHMGDDWNGNGGGNSDYGDPVLAIAHGKVVYSQNYGSDWGEVVIIRHKYRDSGGSTKYVDSLYGHVISRRVSVGQSVRRGQRIASIGNNRGMYVAHLHLEIRKNINIGIRAWAYPKSYANYHQPTSFINSHRPGKLKTPRPSLNIAKSSPSTKPTDSKKSEAPMLFPLPKPEIVNAPAALLAKLQSSAASVAERNAKSTPSASGSERKSASLASSLGFSRGNTSVVAKTNSSKSSNSSSTTARIRTTIATNNSSTSRSTASLSSERREKNGLFRKVFNKEARIESTSPRERRVSVSHTRSAASSSKGRTSSSSSKSSSSSRSSQKRGLFKKVFSKKK